MIKKGNVRFNFHSEFDAVVLIIKIFSEDLKTFFTIAHTLVCEKSLVLPLRKISIIGVRGKSFGITDKSHVTCFQHFKRVSEEYKETLWGNYFNFHFISSYCIFFQNFDKLPYKKTLKNRKKAQNKISLIQLFSERLLLSMQR